ncbi:hypothetical protein [Acutalibacter muris]|uniref:hypothetical protein n=1 Tax=Acutalibacter muris TaxID=1796620 RepID=UPI00272E23CD|nr:hypothetical protein [Acutalibacter muris]
MFLLSPQGEALFAVDCSGMHHVSEQFFVILKKSYGFRMIPPRPPSFWRAGQNAETANERTYSPPQRKKAFTQFFLEKIAGAGQRPAAARVGPPPA